MSTSIRVTNSCPHDVAAMCRSFYSYRPSQHPFPHSFSDIYLFIRPCQVLVVAQGVFDLHCGDAGSLVAACKLLAVTCGIQFPDQGWDPGLLHWEQGLSHWTASSISFFSLNMSSILGGNPHVFSSVQFSRSVVSDSLRPHELQHARPPCPSPTPGVHSDSRPSSP